MTDTLYRYRSMASLESSKFTLDIIDNGRLYCSAPESFNDPFECQAKISFDAPIALKNARAKERIIKENPGMSTSQAEQLAKTRWKQIEQDGLQEFRHWLRNDTGIVSFSTCNNNILMWSHYAGCHQGICIEFKCTQESHVDFFGQIQTVQYQHDLPVVNFYKTDILEKAKAFVLTKADQWSYEKEWRRLIVPANDNRFLDIPKGCISAIYLGCQLSPENRQILLKHINESSSCRGIRVYQAYRREDAYALSFKVIEKNRDK